MSHTLGGIFATIALVFSTLLVSSGAEATTAASATIVAAVEGWMTDVPTSPWPLDPSDPSIRTGTRGALGSLGVSIVFWKYDAASQTYVWQAPSTAWSTTGSHHSLAVDPGRYRIQFIPGDGAISQGYWTGTATVARYLEDAQDVIVTAGQTFDLGFVNLPARVEDVSQLQGPTRFETATAISQAEYPGTPSATHAPEIVYLASGLNFPDALAAGPAAVALGGVLLLTYPNQLPASIAAELTRLRPLNLVVVGGSDVVSDGVMNAAASAAQLKAGSAQVLRLSGPDRYATANAIVNDAFIANGAKTVFIATGRNYPDALAAGPAAGVMGGPVVLVDGMATSVPPTTLDLIAALHPDRVIIAGDTGVVSAEIENQLDSIYPATTADTGVFRFGGADRFETARMLDEAIFPTTDNAFLAGGYNFPDALTGAPLAAQWSAPIYLTPTPCLGQSAEQGLVDTQPNGVVLLGGDGALSPAVASLTTCQGFATPFDFGLSGNPAPPAILATTAAHNTAQAPFDGVTHLPRTGSR